MLLSRKYPAGATAAVRRRPPVRSRHFRRRTTLRASFASRAAALPGLRGRIAPGLRAPARWQPLALDVQQFQHQPARHRHRLGQPHRHLLRRPRCVSPLSAPISVWLRCVIMEELAPHRADRDQPVRPGLVQLHEQPEPLHARDRAPRTPPPPGPTDRPPDSGRSCRARPPCCAARRPRSACAVSSRFSMSQADSPSFAPAMPRDQRAVHDQVGIAPDGRGEMRVVPQAPARNGRNSPGGNRPASSTAAW